MKDIMKLLFSFCLGVALAAMITCVIGCDQSKSLPLPEKAPQKAKAIVTLWNGPNSFSRRWKSSGSVQYSAGKYWFRDDDTGNEVYVSGNVSVEYQ